MAPSALHHPPPARRHFVSSSTHSPNPLRPGPGPGTDLARLPPDPQPPPSAPAPLPPPSPPLRAAPGARKTPARALRPALVTEPWRGLPAASSGPAPRPAAGRERPGPGRAAGPAPGLLTVRVTGGGARLGAASLSATGPSAAAAAAGRAGGREGREGPSSELSGSGQAPRAGPAVSTSRHCPRETQEKAEGNASPPLPAASGQPPAGAGACAWCGAGKGGGGGGGGSGGGRGRRGAAALGSPRLLLPPPPPLLGRQAPLGALRAPLERSGGPGDPFPVRPLHTGASPALRPLSRGAGPRPGPALL